MGNEFTSTWPILKSLGDKKEKFYISISNSATSNDNILDILEYCNFKNINTQYVIENEMKIQIDKLGNFDLLFIDSIHTYIHVLWQLKSFSPIINKYIVLHDTEAPWGLKNDCIYKGDYLEYPVEYNRNKEGVFNAIQDFLSDNSEWKIIQRFTNNHGLVILGKK